MINAFLGFTFLIAALFPIGGQVAQMGGLHSGLLKGLPPLIVHLAMLLFTLAPAALITAWFFRAVNLRARLPREVPGSGALMWGVVLTCTYLAARLFASTIEGGGPGFVVAQLSPFVLWPARALLAVGVVKLLLGAWPSATSSRTASDAVAQLAAEEK